MKPTKMRLLAALFVVVLVAGWAIFTAIHSAGTAMPELTWQSALLILLFSALVLLTTRRVNSLPLTFVGRLVLLAKTSSHGGAIISGLYLGFALYQIPDTSSKFARDQVIAALANTAAALLLTYLGIALERRLRAPQSKSE